MSAPEEERPGRSWLIPRVLPFRGDQVGAGVVSLVVLVVLLQLRMSWAGGVHLVVVLVAATGVGLLLAGLRPEDRPYVSALVAGELVLVAVVLARLVDLTTDVPSAGTATWVLAAYGLVAALLVRQHRAATATLVCGLVVAALPVAFALWLADPGDGVLRTLLLLSVLVLALGAIATRDRRPTHAAQLANAGGVALGAIVIGPQLDLVLLDDPLTSQPGWGWQLVALVGAFGLVAYGAVDRKRGPVFLGLLDLALFCLSAASGDGLLGWPLVLGIVTAVMLGVGLRPTTPAPPEPGPDRGGPGAPGPLPLPRLGERREPGTTAPFDD